MNACRSLLQGHARLCNRLWASPPQRSNASPKNAKLHGSSLRCIFGGTGTRFVFVRPCSDCAEGRDYSQLCPQGLCLSMLLRCACCCMCKLIVGVVLARME